MPKRVKLITPLPVLGIDTSKPGEYVAARATTFSSNMRVRRSIIEKRPGTEAVGVSLGERIQEQLEYDDGSNQHPIRIGLTAIQELNKATDVWSSIAGAALTGTITDQISYAFPLLSGQRILAYTNGRDPIRKYIGTGTDADLGGSPPRARFVFFFGGYLLLLDVTDSGNRFPWRIQWPDTGAPETWTGGNAGSQELLEDSKGITGPGYFGSNTFTVHKEDSIYIGYLTDTSAVFRFERRDTGAGTIAHRTIKTLPTGEQFFLASDGFRLFNGNTAPLIESSITEDIRDSLNPENSYKSWAKVVRELDEIWCGVPMGSETEPTTIYKFNYVTRQMHVDNRESITAIGEYANTEGQPNWDSLTTSWDGWVGTWDNKRLLSLNPIICFGDSSGVTTRETIGSSDNGIAISATWDAKDITADDFGLDPGMLMEFQEAHIWARGSGTLAIYVSFDGGGMWTLAGNITLTSDYPADTAPQVVYFDQLSARCRIRLSHNGLDQTVQFKQYALMGVPREETDY